MAVLEFKGYSVEQLSYKKNPAYKHSQRTVKLNPSIKINESFDQEKIMVTIMMQIGSLESDQNPFAVMVGVKGEFRYRPDEDQEEIGVDILIKRNAVAILYPYVRALVSDITGRSNDYPAFILPTINVAQILNEQANAANLAD